MKLVMLGGYGQSKETILPAAKMGALRFDADSFEALPLMMASESPREFRRSVSGADVVVAVSAANAAIKNIEVADYIAVCGPVRKRFAQVAAGAVRTTVENAFDVSQRRVAAVSAGIAAFGVVEQVSRHPLWQPYWIDRAIHHSTPHDAIERHLARPDSVHVVAFTNDYLFPLRDYRLTDLSELNIRTSVVEGNHTEIVLNPEYVFDQIAHDRGL